MHTYARIEEPSSWNALQFHGFTNWPLRILPGFRPDVIMVQQKFMSWEDQRLHTVSWWHLAECFYVWRYVGGCTSHLRCFFSVFWYIYIYMYVFSFVAITVPFILISSIFRLYALQCLVRCSSSGCRNPATGREIPIFSHTVATMDEYKSCLHWSSTNWNIG